MTPPKATPARLVGGLPGKWSVRDEPTLKSENRFRQKRIRRLGPNTFVYTTKDGKRGQFTNSVGKTGPKSPGRQALCIQRDKAGNDLVELTDRGRNVSVRISSDRYEFKVGPRGKWEPACGGSWQPAVTGEGRPSPSGRPTIQRRQRSIPRSCRTANCNSIRSCLVSPLNLSRDPREIRQYPVRRSGKEPREVRLRRLL